MQKDIWLKTQEIIDLYKQCSRSISKQGVLNKAQKGWIKRRVGKSFEFLLQSLPSQIIKKYEQNNPLSIFSFVADCNFSISPSYSSNKMLFATFVKQTEEETGKTKTSILQTISFLAKTNSLPPNLLNLLNALQRRKADKFSVRTLYYFLEETEKDNKTITIPHKSELEGFLRFYQNRHNPSVAEAWRSYKAFEEENGRKPLSYSAVLARLSKLPDYVKEKGRKTGSAMKALKTYQRRDWGALRVNDCWAGDGHSLHAKVKHPITGKAFRPEITLIIDCHSRFVVGWSVSFAENTLAVANALRYGMEHYGVPLIYYSDNGAGQTNKVLDDDCTGILTRLGVAHQKAIAGNPQARGIIERLMGSLGKNIAKQLPTYFDKQTDKESTRKMLYAVQSAAKANAEGRELTPLQQKGLTALPLWEDLIAVIKQEVDKYNNTPHSAFKKTKTPAEVFYAGVAELKAKNDFEELPPELSQYFFKPAFTRIVRQGYIEIMGGWYWNEKLIDFSKQKVICLIDIYDPKKITIEDLKHRFICEAKLEGNTNAGMPLAYVDYLQEKRKERKQKKSIQEYQDAIQETKRIETCQAQDQIFSILENSQSDRQELLLKNKEQEKQKLLTELLANYKVS